MNVIFIVLGVLAIAVPFFGKGEYHNADISALSEIPGKVSAWSGRLLFIVVGVCFLAFGIMGFMKQQ